MPKPIKAEAVLGQVKKAWKERNWVLAVELLDALLARFPKNVRARKALEEVRGAAIPDLMQQAQTHLATKDWIEAERHLSAAFRLSPDDLGIGVQLARCQVDMGRPPAAVKTAGRLLARYPDHAELLNIQGRALLEMSQLDRARACFETAHAQNPQDVRTLNNLGILERAAGRREQAAGYYQQALNIRPDDINIHSNLAQVTDYSAGDAHLDAMLAKAKTANPADPSTAPLYFALFKALDDTGNRDAAYGYLEKANRLAATQAGYDFQKDMIPFAVAKTLFAQRPAFDIPDDSALRPIFVTGLPRSGTTLVERILAQAEGVQACGELMVVQPIVSRVVRGIMSRDTKALTTADILELRHDLLTGLAQYSDGSPRIIDKMPLNFRWIGYLCAALPEAKIIHVTRAPMPVAWSLYRLMFQGEGNRFVYDRNDIARYMLLHENYRAFWQDLYPDRVFELSYEDLVSNTEETTQRLAQAVDLDWTEAWLAPHRVSGQVLTASSDQVRKPIYKDSHTGWQRYREELAPLQDALTTIGVIQR